MISMHTKHKTFVRCFTFLFSSKSSKPRVHVPLRAQRRSLSHISNSLATHSCGHRIEKVTFNFDNVWPYEVLPTLRSVLGSLKDNAGHRRKNYNSSCPSPGRASTSSPAPCFPSIACWSQLSQPVLSPLMSPWFGPSPGVWQQPLTVHLICSLRWSLHPAQFLSTCVTFSITCPHWCLPLRKSAWILTAENQTVEEFHRAE